MTSSLVSRPGREVTWSGVSPCSASKRAATGVGFGCCATGPGCPGAVAPAGTASPMRAIAVSTATVVPWGTSSSSSVPATGEGSSVVILSVSIEASASPWLTSSPTCLSHWPTVPSTSVSASFGIRTSVSLNQRILFDVALHGPEQGTGVSAIQGTMIDAGAQICGRRQGEPTLAHNEPLFDRADPHRRHLTGQDQWNGEQ